MSAMVMEFDPWLATAIEAQVLTPLQAWCLLWETEVRPTEPYPEPLRPLASRVELLHLPVSSPLQ